MADIKRFVTYLYYYEHNTKLHIAGFAKVEVRDGQCRLEIHLKAAGIAGRSIPIYLFAREGDLIRAIEIGSMNMGALSGDYKAILKDRAIGHSIYDMSDIRGMLLILDDKKMFASQWDDEEMIREQITIYEPKLMAAGESRTEAVMQRKEVKRAEEAEEAEKPEKPKEAEEAEKAEKPEKPKEAEKKEVQEEQQPLHAEELPMRKIITPDFTTKRTLWEYWEDIKKKMTIIHPFEGKQILCVHMELRDIRELPRKYWYLGNNSFLLRGFFHYKYLLMGEVEKEEERELFIGVPGTYQKQEKVVASIFGFTEFFGEKKKDTEDGRFGYWCHFIGE